MLEQKYKEIILEIFSKYFDDYQLLLFGSRARQDNDSVSDLDLALKRQNDAKLNYKISCIKEDLEESIIPYKIDLLDYFSIDASMQQAINREGILLNV
ncbi:MAG: nucleotidyltransferase domain-containing protein [Candidatus Caenarcaniphilales bacterium]|jgi:hypothetical protein|nr:nucleotidyltransferase domain-containing protein [Candidatus Caenarcaniphilales bacterium]